MNSTAIRNLAGNTIFSVEFVKRTTGELRKMNCRLGVSKGVKGTGMRFNPDAKDLIPVYEMPRGTKKKAQWRMINLRSVRSIRVKGKIYREEP